jgi:hypothetical protein
MRFAHLKVQHGFERLRLRGLSGAHDEFYRKPPLKAALLGPTLWPSLLGRNGDAAASPFEKGCAQEPIPEAGKGQWQNLLQRTPRRVVVVIATSTPNERDFVAEL